MKKEEILALFKSYEDAVCTVREICEKVGISPIPYKMRKSVGVQILGQKIEDKENQGVTETDISNTG